MVFVHNTSSLIRNKKLMNFSSFFEGKIKAGSIKGGVITLVSGTLGTGLIIFPYCLYKAGLIYGSLLIMISAFLSY